jgi:hypothetical protein
MMFLSISIYLILAVLLLGSIIFIVKFRFLDFGFKAIGIFILTNFVVQLISFFNFGYNLYFVAIYGLFELILFSVLYGRFINFKHKTLFVIIVTVISTLLIYEGVTSYVNQNVESFNSYGKIFSHLTIITYSVYYIIDTLINKSKKIEPQKINLSFVILIFYVITLINFIAINFLVNNSLQIVVYFWNFYAVLNVLFYGALTFLLWKHGKSRKYLR